MSASGVITHETLLTFSPTTLNAPVPDASQHLAELHIELL